MYVCIYIQKRKKNRNYKVFVYLMKKKIFTCKVQRVGRQLNGTIEVQTKQKHLSLLYHRRSSTNRVLLRSV